MPSVMIVAGGTGGHLYPGVALGRALAQRGWAVAFIVRPTDLGREELEREKFAVHFVSGQGMPRRASLKAFQFPLRLAQGFGQTRRLLMDHRPDVVVGMGGYLSFPVLLTARLMGIPTMIHEQNFFPGVANRFLARYVDSVAVSFEESLAYFPKKKAWVSGLPVRQEIGRVSKPDARRRFGLNADGFTCLIFGGSQGAHRLNDIIVEAWKRLSGVMMQVIHITGKTDHAAIERAYGALPFCAVVLPYCQDMPSAYAAADLVICRSGASTVMELAAAQRPSILIPYPHASGNHQWFNAQLLAKRGVAEVIEEKDLESGSLAQRIKTLIEQPNRLEALRASFDRSPASAGAPPADRLANRVDALARGEKLL